MKSSENPLGSEPVSTLLRRFAVPSVIAMLVSALYNMVDQLFIGHSIGVLGNAATNVAFPLSMVCTSIGLLCGIGGAANFNLCMGRREPEHAKSYVGSAISMLAILGVILCVAVQLFLRPMMLLFGATPDVIDYACTYTRITSIGFPFLIVTIGGSNLIRADGSPKFSMLCNLVGAIVNTILDPLFIFVFHMGMAGAALATIISQFISALLCLRRLLRSPEEYRLVPSRIRFDPIMLKQIISNGLPAGLQNSIIALANVVVQSNINSFGKMAVAGCGAYSKVEGFGFLPITCFSLALTTFISQNLGAKQYDRAKRGARFGILCSITLAEIVGICVYFLSPYLIAAFNSDPQVVAYGTLQAHTITLFYFLLAFSHCIAGIMRGAGKATVPMFVMLCCWCIIRVTYITITVRIFPVINTIFWAYPLTWTLSSILFFLYYRKADWIHGFEKK